MRDIFVFLHAYTMFKYKEIFTEIFNKSTELFNRCSKYYICVVGPGRMEDIVPKDDKIEIIYFKDDPNLYEFPTFNFLRKICKERECYILYHHLKGLTFYDNPAVIDWRHYMTYFNIEKHEMCLNFLEKGFDAVGVDLLTWPTLHYSGNFWWSKSEHINSLVAPEDLPAIPNFYSADDKKHRHRCEMWICSRPNGHYLSLWNSGIHPSLRGNTRYTKDKYIRL